MDKILTREYNGWNKTKWQTIMKGEYPEMPNFLTYSWIDKHRIRLQWDKEKSNNGWINDSSFFGANKKH